MLDAYTRVLESAASVAEEAQVDALISKLVEHLAATGRTKLLPQIHAELKKIAARRLALAPVVEVASEKEAAAALRAAAASGIVAKHARVNPALVKGWRARGHGMLVDRSAKRALVEMYRNVTS